MVTEIAEEGQAITPRSDIQRKLRGDLPTAPIQHHQLNIAEFHNWFLVSKVTAIHIEYHVRVIDFCVCDDRRFHVVWVGEVCGT
jgi:hypothetical protein